MTLRNRITSRPHVPGHADKPWRTTEYVAIDIETTGLDPRTDSVVSYGVVPIREGRIVSRDTIYSLVDPGRSVPANSVRVHGLRTADLVGAPGTRECVEALRELFRDRILVAHAAWVEQQFLRRLFKQHGVRFDHPFIDTAELSRRVLDIDTPPGESVSLEYAATVLRLPVHTPHHALGDAMTTAELMLLLSTRLDPDHNLTGRDLIRMSTADTATARHRF